MDMLLTLLLGAVHPNLPMPTGTGKLSVEGTETQIAPHVKTALFRIVQEALSNIIHHAKVKKAMLRMLYTEAAISILIEDKGVGFDAEATLNAQTVDAAQAHFGILGMKERAMIIGAQLALTSNKDA